MAIAELDRTPMPQRIAALPRDARGYPIPWFVYIGADGKPDFRVIGNAPGSAKVSKIAYAINHRLCWVCGQVMGRNMAFVVGPMCTISRTVPEPPSHLECAEYSAKVCPFLARPSMHRQEHNMLPDRVDPAGMMIARNPGVIAVWVTRTYYQRQSSDLQPGSTGMLIEMGEPEAVSWYHKGLLTTDPVPVWESIESGLPALAAAAISQSPKALRDLLLFVRETARIIQPKGELPDLNQMVLRAAEAAPPPEVTRQLASFRARVEADALR